jgi:Domain of unknown function (DUF397)
MTDLSERDWRRSTLCATADCVEVRISGNDVNVRSSREQHNLMLRFDRSEWMEFIVGVRNGEFDLRSK